MCKKLSSAVKEAEPGWKGKLTFVYLVLTNSDEKALAEKLEIAKPTTIVFIGKDGKIISTHTGVLDKKGVDDLIKATFK